MKFGLREKITLLLLIVVALLAGIAMAVTPVRETVTLDEGAGSWTASENYKTYKVKAVYVTGALPATETGTVYHVVGDVTNTVASIVCTGGAGSYQETNTTYVFKGDSIVIGGGITNDATVQVVMEVYP